MIIIQVVTRLLAFVGKEIVEVVRRPGAMASLILGPFLIMAVFGLGYQGYRAPISAIVVAPQGSGLPTDPASYRGAAGLDVRSVATDRAGAEARLRAREVDAVVVFPADIQAQFAAGRQSTITIETNLIDPVDIGFATALASSVASMTNERIIEAAVKQAQGQAAGAGAGSVATSIPPRVVASPTTAVVTNVAPTTPGVIAFYGPAMLALIVQHLAVTLIALSLVRERMTGIVELYRLAPINALEVIAGKLLAFGVLGAVIAAASVALMVAILHVPILAGPLAIAGAIALLLLASLGIGLIIALVSDSERTAIQLGLLVLLASVFFSGFVVKLDEFYAPVRALGYLLPVSHGVVLLQDLMLYGWTPNPWHLAALATIAAVTVLSSWVLLRRAMASA